MSAIFTGSGTWVVSRMVPGALTPLLCRSGLRASPEAGGNALCTYAALIASLEACRFLYRLYATGQPPFQCCTRRKRHALNCHTVGAPVPHWQLRSSLEGGQSLRGQIRAQGSIPVDMFAQISTQVHLQVFRSFSSTQARPRKRSWYWWLLVGLQSARIFGVGSSPSLTRTRAFKPPEARPNRWLRSGAQTALSDLLDMFVARLNCPGRGYDPRTDFDQDHGVLVLWLRKRRVRRSSTLGDLRRARDLGFAPRELELARESSSSHHM